MSFGNFIKVPDTTLLHNGTIYRLPIYAELNLDNIQSIEIEFNFDYSLLNIVKVTTDQNNIIGEVNPYFEITQQNFKQGTLRIVSSNLNKINNKILCFVELEPLFGMDSISKFIPFKVKFNGIEDNIIKLIPGIINIGFPLEQIIKEGISRIYPNPFDSEFYVDFAIEKPSKIDFTIYSTLGRVVFSFPNKSSEAYEFFNSKGEKIDNPTDYIFLKGYYKLKVKSSPWQFSSGVFFLQMTTASGVYNQNLLHQK